MTPEEIRHQFLGFAEKWADENSVGTIDKFERVEAFLAGVVWRETYVQDLIESRDAWKKLAQQNEPTIPV